MIFKLVLITLFAFLVQAQHDDDSAIDSHPYPFVVSLQKLSDKYGTLTKYCSGVIVSALWVLTNLQCVNEDIIKQHEIIVHAGILNAYDYTSKNSQSRKVTKIIKLKFKDDSPQISATPIDGIVMLKMDKPFVWKIIRPAMISDTLNVTGHGEVIGWGASAFPADENQSKSLLFAPLRVLDHDKCKKYYKDVKGKFCIGTADQVACSGDAGGAFVQYDQKTGEQIVVGLASIGAVPCTSKPALYINIAPYIHLIATTIKDE